MESRGLVRTSVCEQKKQKTLITLRHGIRHRRSHMHPAETKKFLVLFFKKEQLPSLTPRITPKIKPRKAEQRNEETT
jgi:hypothetical protein